MTEGDRFRVAHPRQISLNKRRMPREVTYHVTRVYEMKPNTIISVEEANPGDGFYSLGPKTPVLLPKEPDPTEEEVLKFLGVQSKKRVVAYRVLWDGKLDLAGVVPPQAVACMKLMFSMGKDTYTVRELNELFTQHYEKFLGKPTPMMPSSVISFYRRHLVNKGLMEEIVDVGPIPLSVREANLQEVY